MVHQMAGFLNRP